MHVVANPNDVSVLKNKVFESSTAKPDKVLEKNSVSGSKTTEVMAVEVEMRIKHKANGIGKIISVIEDRFQALFEGGGVNIIMSSVLQKDYFQKV